MRNDVIARATQASLRIVSGFLLFCPGTMKIFGWFGGMPAGVALSPLLRTAFVLREVQGYSTGEAAKKLGVTENTLKARLWRARHQMAERLGRRLKRMKDDMTGGMADPDCAYC